MRLNNILITAMILIGFASLAEGQNCDQPGLPSYTEFYRVFEDSVENEVRDVVRKSAYYVGSNDTAYIVSTATKITSSNDSNMVLFKMNEYGKVEWMKQYAWADRNEGTSVIKVEDGFAVAGYLFDNNSQNNKIFLMRTDLSGNTLWMRTYESQEYVSRPIVRQNDDGQFIIAASHSAWRYNQYPSQDDDLNMLKTDNNGNLINYRRYSPGRHWERFNEMMPLSPDLSVSIGKSGHVWDFRGGLLQTFDQNNGLVTDLHYRVQTPSGNYDLRGSEDERSKMVFHDVVEADNGNLILVGSHSNSDQYGNGAATYLNGIVVEVDPGNNYSVIWSKEYQLDNGDFTRFTDITIKGNSAENGFVISGTAGITSGTRNSVVLEIDRNGSFIWAKTMGSNEDHRVQKVMYQPSSGDVLAKGFIQDSLSDYNKPYFARFDQNTDIGCITSVQFVPSDIPVERLRLGSNEIDTEVNELERTIEYFTSCPELKGCSGDDYDPCNYESSLSASRTFYRVFKDSVEDAVRDRVRKSAYYQGSNDTAYIVSTATKITSSGDSNMVLFKMSEYGKVAWMKQYTWSDRNEGTSVIKVEGGFAVAGYLFDNNSQNNKIFLMRTDLSGNTLWMRTYESQEYVSRPIVRQNDEGQFIIAASHSAARYNQYPSQDDDLNMLKTDNNGNLINYRRYTPRRHWERFTEMMPLSPDLSVSIGKSGHVWDFRGGLLQTFDQNNGLVTDLHYRVQTPSGNYDLWGNEDERSKMLFHDVVEADNGNLILVGSHSNSDQYGDGAATYLNGIVVEVDPSNNYSVVWSNEYQLDNGDFTRFLDITIKGNSAENGFLISGTAGITSGTRNSVVLEIGRNGSFNWAKTIGRNEDHKAQKVMYQPVNGDVLVKGIMEETQNGFKKPYFARFDQNTETECISSVQFMPDQITLERLNLGSDPIDTDITTRSHQIAHDLNCPELRSCDVALPEPNAASMEDEEAQSEQSLTIYPNPVGEETNVTLESKEEMERIAIYNIRGQKKMETQADGKEQRLKLEGLAKGVYLLEVATHSDVLHERVVVE